MANVRHCQLCKPLRFRTCAISLKTWYSIPPSYVAMDNSKGCFICAYTCINIYIYIHTYTYNIYIYVNIYIYMYVYIYIYMYFNIIYKDKDVTPTNIPVTWPWRLPLPYWISTSRLIEMQLPLQSCTCSRPQHALPVAPTQTGFYHFYQDPQKLRFEELQALHRTQKKKRAKLFPTTEKYCTFFGVCHLRQ